ncbi:MAG TPA: hypothetical protein PK122_00510 [Candidatus Paceibacterota bacterium]|nr:hypothetical protein [Candidatus Paceibacterota bacterium]
MSDGITEARRGTYFLDRSESPEERERRYNEEMERLKQKRIEVVKMIQAETDLEKAQDILLKFLYNPRP